MDILHGRLANEPGAVVWLTSVARDVDAGWRRCSPRPC